MVILTRRDCKLQLMKTRHVRVLTDDEGQCVLRSTILTEMPLLDSTSKANEPTPDKATSVIQHLLIVFSCRVRWSDRSVIKRWTDVNSPKLEYRFSIWFCISSVDSGSFFSAFPPWPLLSSPRHFSLMFIRYSLVLSLSLRFHIFSFFNSFF